MEKHWHLLGHGKTVGVWSVYSHTNVGGLIKRLESGSATMRQEGNQTRTGDPMFVKTEMTGPFMMEMPISEDDNTCTSELKKLSVELIR